MAPRKTALIITLLCLLASVLAGCLTPPPEPTAQPSPSASASPSATFTLTPSPVPTHSFTPTATFDPLRPWDSFPGPDPRQTPVTPVPPPVPALAHPDEVQVLVLLGSDSNAPYVSRTDAIQIILYHPRLARASLISVPPDLMVYIPGYNMQRLQVAYAVGGWFGLANTLQYNLGIRPNHYVLVHLDEFSRFIDKYLGGLDVTSLQAYPDPKFCGGIPTGTFHMTGSQVLCYLSFREGTDEADRNRRQQEVFRLILLRMVQSGSLTRLPEMVNAFRQTIETDLQLQDLIEAIPLTLKLGDAHRVNFYHLGPDELTLWQIPEDLRPSVFLPRPKAILPILQDAINFIQTPAPLSEIVKTYEAALTVLPSPTASPVPSINNTRTVTRTATITPLRTATRTPTFASPTPTPTGPTSPFTATQPGYDLR